MPITNACCCICGIVVIDESGHPSWMAQFRALYAVGHEANAQVWLSGLGRRQQLTDLVDAAPSSSTTDDEEPLRIDLMRSNPGRNLAVQTSPDFPQVWGFPFHSSCWNMLTVPHLTENLDIQTLFNLCRSFPNRASLLNWGHGYGGLARFKIALAPAEEPELEDPSAPSEHMLDPFQIPELYQLFAQQKSGPLTKSLHPDAGSVSHVSQLAEDSYFGRLPHEILLEILDYLPSFDVVSLKLASRVYARLPLADSFWKSRFFPGREFDYVFEAENYFSSLNGHWRYMFDSVKALKEQPVVQNRKRIWDLCLSLHEVLASAGAGTCGGNPVKSFFEPNAPPDDRSWVITSRCLKSPADILFKGARSLYDRTIKLPSGEIAVFASLIDLFGRRYISGIRITDGNGESISLGYRHAENETLLSPIGEIGCISGFVLALDERGVRGLSMSSHTGAVSNWVGDHVGIPKRMLLPASQDSICIDLLKGGFDALKLVYLAVPSLRETDSETKLQRRFQDTALWYPSLPDSPLTFLGLSENTRVSQLNEEYPLCFNNFGGLNGENAHSLINVTIHSREWGHVVLINVHFTDTQPTSALGFESSDADIIDEFAIEGPGGERIVGLETVHGWDQLLGFKIHTNRNRVGAFPTGFENDLPSDGGEIRSIHAEGETIVGFWGIMQTRSGFWDIGLAATAIISKQKS